MHVLDHGPARQSTRVTSTDKDPGGLSRTDGVAARHSELDILGEVFEIVNSLLDSVELQVWCAQVRYRIGFPVEAVLKDDGRAVLLLGNLAVDSPVCEVALVTYGREVQGRLS